MANNVQKNKSTEVQKHEKDTGSTAVQIVGLTQEIELLTKHLFVYKKDFSCRRSLLKKVAARKRFFRYLEKTDTVMYEKVKSLLELK